MGFRLSRAGGSVKRHVAAALVALLAVGLSAPAVRAACDEARAELRGDWGVARFRVAIVDTPESRARGLMFVEEMPRAAGMLFVFPDERLRSFWMRNTLIPLDILYFDAAGRWVSAAENAVPLDETGLPSDGPAQYVLEINGGLAAQFGMGPGTELRHPRIAQDIAAWPCDTE